MENLNETKKWAANRFGISPDEVLWYHSGSCYDRVGVTTKEAAAKVAEKVKGETANGGMFHGMPLGGATECKADGGETYYDVYC